MQCCYVLRGTKVLAVAFKLEERRIRVGGAELEEEEEEVCTVEEEEKVLFRLLLLVVVLLLMFLLVRVF
jgi:hypothetical protein